jgi:hypothetical protein
MLGIFVSPKRGAVGLVLVCMHVSAIKEEAWLIQGQSTGCDAEKKPMFSMSNTCSAHGDRFADAGSKQEVIGKSHKT